MQAENKNLSYYKKKAIPSGKNLRIGIVVSEWNHNITENLFTGAYKTLLDLEVEKHNIERINVPGSFELIYGAKIISKRKLDAIICLGSIIKGETKHFDFISNAIANGIQELNIKLNIPVILFTYFNPLLSFGFNRFCEIIYCQFFISQIVIS